MTLSELESELNVQFPEQFYKIYNSGAVLNGFELLSAEQIPEHIAYMEQWFFDFLEKEHGFVRRKDVRLIPFAQISSVDLYCLLYEENLPEPKVVFWWHDEYMPVLIGRNFDEFLYHIMICSAYNEEDIHGEDWKKYYQILSEEYQKKLDSIPEEDLPYAEEDTVRTAVNIWEHWKEILS